MSAYLIPAGIIAATALMAWLLWRRAQKHKDDPPSDSGGFL